MSHINSIKTRLEEIFLRDRGNIDEQSAALLKSDLKDLLTQYFILKEFSVQLTPRDDGEVDICVHASGRRLHRDIK